jgi:hypothetical protein
MKWTKSENKWQYFPIDWPATRMWALSKPDIQVFVTGPDGIVFIATLSGNTEEEIDSSAEGPRARGPIRDLRFIGDHLYATGMGRQVYRREGSNKWERADKGMVRPVSSEEICGFNSIDGLNENEIYATGFAGEIWCFSDDKWDKMESPTNLILHRVRTITPSKVFCSGQNGLLIKGAHNRWEIIDHGATDSNIWGLEWFRDKLFVACDDGLFIYKGSNELEKLDLDLGENISHRHLHANNGILMSFGPKNIVWTEDGKHWSDITPGR